MQRQHRIVDAGPGGQGKRAVGLERRFVFVETVGFVVMNEYLTIPLRVSQSLWDKTMPHDTPDLSFHVRSVCLRYISWTFLGLSDGWESSHIFVVSDLSGKSDRAL